MVLTDEQQVNYYPATTLEGIFSYTAREVNSLVNHEKKFYRIDPVYIVNKPWSSTTLDYQNHNNVPLTNPNLNYPAGAGPLQSATSKKVYSLNAGTNRTGLEMVIKVMAGDKIDIFGRSYHSNGSAVSNSNSTPLSILQIMSGIISSPSNALGSKGVTASQLESWNSSLLPSTFIRGQNFETGTTIPKAYINYIFLDEQFRYVTGNASRVGSAGSVKQHWSELSNITAQKNGYLLVYVSNESNFTVFFDNLQVVHKPGPIVEDTHYYPFGLVMNGISSKGFSGVVENKKKYNGIERNSDFDLNMYDAFYRNLDPQIGRFWQTDPSPSFNLGLYTAFDNNPILKNDILGDTAVTRWRSGFLGLGAKHEARYVGGTWIDSKTRNAIDPKSVRSGARSIMNDYGKLNSISSFSALTDKVNSTVNSVNLISGNGPASGGSEINTLKYFSDLKAGVTNPDIDVYVAKGQSISSSIIEGNKGGQLPSYIGMGHELGHAWDILNSGSSTANFRQIPGLSPGLSNSEVNAMFWENVLRADAGMPLRTMYNYDAVRGAELPANINISNAGRLPLIGRTLQSVTLGSLNMGVTYKFLRIK